MKNVSAIIPALILVVFFWGCNNSGKQTDKLKAGKKPNIIFILTDDQRWDALGFARNDIIQTPNMDKLASSGIYFKNAFVTTPICAASRASLFTGLYERTHDFTFGRNKLINKQYMYESYPYLLKNAGYRTGFVGKFGVKVNEGIEDSLFNSFIKTAYPYMKEVDGKQVHLADINGNHAIDFIKSDNEQPFCLSLSFWSPHADDGSEEQYFWPKYCDSLYAENTIPTPETANPAFFEALPDYLKTTMNRKRWHWRYDTPEKFQQMVKGYYKMISAVDSVIGRIETTLKEEGLADNTVIVFMGDNGYFLGERGYAGKWMMHEQSIRVPMMIYDPRQPESERSKTYDEMVLNIDVTPTILDLAGVNIPKKIPRQKFNPILRKSSRKLENIYILRTSVGKQPLIPRTECFRDDEWKFIRYDDAPELIELYNYSVDVNETKNLAYDPEFADKVEYYAHKCDSVANKLMSDRIENTKN